MATSSDQCMTKFINALKNDVSNRCLEIKRISDEYSSKELHNIFPLLVEDIFGVTCKVDWSLRSIYEDADVANFATVTWFFGPEGPFINMCYKLMSNNFYLKYEFPLAFLPISVRKMIDDGLVSTFYSKFLKIDALTGKPTALSLNPFEFYIFHFAYHLVNPCIQRGSAIVNRWNTAYLTLANIYLAYFLPCDQNIAVPPLIGFYMTKSSTPLQTTNRPMRLPTLFRQSVLVSQSNTSSSLHSSPNSSLQNAWLEIWRSELIAQVFLDFWLSSNTREANNPMNRSTLPELYTSPAAQAMQYNQLSAVPNVNPQNLSFCYPQLPSTEHIRVVRVFLKHMHFFANSYANNGTALDELRRLIVPSSQAKIYTFLRRSIDQWPLDTSFRIILETWLSFIQPWRYLSLSDHKTPSQREEEDRVVDPQWMGFIAENLLVYTVVFRQVVNRFGRLDMTTPKNVLMLGRLSKIFYQTNLCSIIAEVESCLDETITASSLPHKWTALIRQQIIELEGPDFNYIPLFGQQTDIEMKRFILFLRESLRVAEGVLLHEQSEANKHPKSFFTFITGIFSTQDNVGSGDYTLLERKNVIGQLKRSIEELSRLFKIENLDTTASSFNTSLMGETYTFSDVTNPVEASTYLQHPTDRSMHTPIRNSPKAMRERIQQVRYEGDPDLEPIRSTENTLLVRLLYQVTTKLNEMYSAEMENYYYRDDLIGRVARQILCPPKTIRRFDKSFTGGQTPRIESTLPPRLSLRSLASHQFLAYYFVGIVIAYFFDYGPVWFTFILIAAWVLYIFIHALVSPCLRMISCSLPNNRNESNASSSNSFGHSCSPAS